MRWVVLFALLVWAPPTRADLAEAEEAAKKFELPAGFKVEAVAAEPLLANPVAFSIDEQGRIFVAETYRMDTAVLDITKHTNWIPSDLGLRRVQDREKFLTNAFGTNAAILTRNSELLAMLTDTNADGRVDARKVLAGSRQVTSGLAAGVLARGNKVWFACIPDLWRFENPTATNVTARKLSSGYGVHIGVTGHDLHGLTIGMDGKLYFSVGDRGFVVQARNGGVLNYPDTGGVLRCNQDGSDLEVVAIGLRNPQELAFDEFGNLWTGDNDTAGADKSRLIYVVDGADYGWRASYQHMKGFGPWVQDKLWEGRLDGTLPSCGEPAQGPAGFAYYPGTGLPESFKGSFLMCDFPGGIQSFRVEPQGASYVIKEKKRFLWTAWPTDLEFGPDGALYFSDWVNGWTLPQMGRIYRLTHADVLADPKTAATAKILREGFDSKKQDELIELLGHHDLRVRQGAHLILGRKLAARAALEAVATDDTKPRPARLHAIWALRMQGSIDTGPMEKLLASGDAEIRAQAVPSGSIAAVVKMLKDESPRVRFFAAMGLRTKLLLDSNNSLVAAGALDLLEQNADKDPYLTHAGVQLLTYSRPALQRARNHTSLAVRRAAMLAERRLGSATIGIYLKDPALVYETARAINDAPVPSGAAALAGLITNNPPENVLSRVINANYRIGGPIAAGHLAAFAATNGPLTARLDALGCLADWEQPNDLDRVVGLWRPVPSDIRRRPDSVAIAALDPHWKTLFRDTEKEIVLAALRCVSDLNVRERATNVWALFQSKDQPEEIRTRALEVLGEFGDTNFPMAIESALKEKALRLGALKLATTNATRAAVNAVLQIASQESDAKTLQAAFGALGRLAPPEGEAIVKKAIEKKDLPAEAKLDVLMAAAKYPALKAGEIPPEAMLLGGDAAEGRKVFEEKTEVSCLRCHAVKGNGGTVGPTLDGIGGKQTREYLLESILYPNKAIAKDFEGVVINLKNGQSVAGIFVKESDTTVEINSMEDGKVILKKIDIKGASRTASAMPEGLGQLMTPFEIRDLVEFLASLK